MQYKYINDSKFVNLLQIIPLHTAKDIYKWITKITK